MTSDYVLNAWLVALCGLPLYGGVLVWLAVALTRPGPPLPPYGHPVVPLDGPTVPVARGRVPMARIVTPGDPYARFPLEPEYPGKHRSGWPAAEVRQIGAGTGEYAVVDLTEVRWGVDSGELVGGGVR